MKRIVSFLIFSTIFLSSCIEIIEEININDDKSGSISYRLETNELAALLNNISGFMDISFENQLKTEATKFAAKIKKMEGIQNVVLETDEGLGGYKFSFDFSSAKKLNKALYEATGNKKTIFSPSYIKISKHKIKKLNFAPWVKKYFEKEDINIPDKNILNMITYKSLIHLPNEITWKNKIRAKILNNQKTVSQSFSIENVFENKVDVGIKIKY